MATFSRIDVALTMRQTGIVPVFYHTDPEICRQVLMACYRGGARVFEFTNRGDFAHEAFADLLRYSQEHAPEMILGIGSILDAPTAALYLQLGANFIVSPILNPEVGKLCNRRKVAWSPGCGSVSEISQAEELGAEVVKIFPGAPVGGPSFVKGVLGPMPWSSIMPTGGVSPTEENLKGWFQAGVHCVGLGSQLVTKSIVENKDWETLEGLVRQSIGWASQYRKG